MTVVEEPLFKMTHHRAGKLMPAVVEARFLPGRALQGLCGIVAPFSQSKHAKTARAR